MTQDAEHAEIIQAIMDRVSYLTAHLNNPAQSLLSPEMDSLSHILQDMTWLSHYLFGHTDNTNQAAAQYWQEALVQLQSDLTHWRTHTEFPIADKRFNTKDWTKNPFFSILSQQYLLASKHISDFIKTIPCENKALHKRIRFFSQQYLDTLSPDHFIQSNPMIIEKIWATNGQNILRGFKQLLDDIEPNPWRWQINRSAPNAFILGQNIAVTKGHVVFKNDLIELIQYTPITKTVHSKPLLIIPPWINKYYILDLSPHNSLVRSLLAQGITVFLISWANPDARFANIGLSDYLIQGPLAALNFIQHRLSVAEINTLGFCLGGTLLVMLLAYEKALNHHRIRSASFFASLFDFTDPGDIAVYLDEAQIEALENRMHQTGYLDGHYMASAFNSLRARDLIWSFFIKNYLIGENPPPFDFLHWNADTTNMPATMHSEYLRWMYLNNDLVKPCKIILNQVPIDIHNITIPTCFVATEQDHIAPWQAVYLGAQLMKGKTRFILGGSGHIAGIINPSDSKKYGYYTHTRLLKKALDWRSKATHHPGSWWPEWFAWLKKKSGNQIQATTIEDNSNPEAPGIYVREESMVSHECSQ